MSISLPEKCLRNLTDCQPLSQISSDCNTSFICCGINDGTGRQIEKDRFTVCFKNAEIDELSHWDRRDIIDQMSVFAQALSADENWRVSQGEEVDGDSSNGVTRYLISRFLKIMRRTRMILIRLG